MRERVRKRAQGPIERERIAEISVGSLCETAETERVVFDPGPDFKVQLLFVVVIIIYDVL